MRKKHIYWPDEVLAEDDNLRTEWLPEQITLDDPSASLLIDVYGSADEAFDRALGEGRH